MVVLRSASNRLRVGRCVLAVTGALLTTAFAQHAAAQTLIGGATVIRNDVSGDLLGRRSKMTVGDRIFQDQSVQTASDSQAKFVFLDLTNMSLGPQSQVKLDKFVYDGEGKAKSVSVTALKGAFRFISGQSQHDAYQVTTPQAVIGVRGTTYDVQVEGLRTIVVLQEGEVNVCVRNSANCRTLNEPGTSVSVTQNDIEGPIPATNKPWDFGSLCPPGGATDLCNRTTQLASLNPLPAAAPPASARPQRRQARAPVVAPRPRYAEPPPRARRPVRVARPPIDYDDYPPPYYGPRPVYVPPVVAIPPYGGGYWPRPPRYPRPGMGPGGRPPVVGRPPYPGRPYPGRPPGMGGGGRPGGPILGVPQRPSGGMGGGSILRSGPSRGPVIR